MKKGLFGERVELLNRAVQKEIAPHLFLVCNYRALPAPTIHADARFLAWIQEMYKVTVDCGDLVRNLEHIVPKWLCGKLPELRELVEGKIAAQVQTVKMLRAMIDHNNDIMGGAEQQANIKQYESWMQLRIKKTVPETEQDYEALSRYMQEFAEELYNNLTELIKMISALAQKDKEIVIQKWEEQILRWYTRPYGNVYYGHLALDYISRVQSQEGREFKYSSSKEMNRYLDRWVEALLFGEQLVLIRALEAAIDEFGPRPELVGKLESTKQELDEEITKRGGVQKAFLKQLPTQLRETLKMHKCSMLPQELITLDIERCFGAVPIPQ